MFLFFTQEQYMWFHIIFSCHCITAPLLLHQNGPFITFQMHEMTQNCNSTLLNWSKIGFWTILAGQKWPKFDVLANFWSISECLNLCISSHPCVSSTAARCIILLLFQLKANQNSIRVSRPACESSSEPIRIQCV